MLIYKSNFTVFEIVLLKIIGNMLILTSNSFLAIVVNKTLKTRTKFTFK